MRKLVGYLLSLVLSAAVYAEGTITPGSGFTGPTSQPSAVGSGDGVNAKVIGCFDTVPYQTFTQNFNIGVVAFHKNGINRVDISANGGPWTSITSMSLNPQTNVHCYWATIPISLCPDGPVEVRAIAYPTVGIPRVISYNYQHNLQSGGPEIFACQLYANGNGTLGDEIRYVSPTGSNNNNGLTPQTPYQTTLFAAQQIQNAQGGNAGGGTIYLLAGNYPMPDFGTTISSPNRWLTIAAAPNLNADQVVITSGNNTGLLNGLLEYRNIRLNSGGAGRQLNCNGGGIWQRGMKVIGVNTYDNGGCITNHRQAPKGIFTTECQFINLYQPLTGNTLIRNVYVDGVQNDLFATPRYILNVSAFNHAEVDSAEHSDFVGWENLLLGIDNCENYIFYNVSSIDSGPVQSFYDDDAQWGCDSTRDNVAFVNVLFNEDRDGGGTGQWSGCIATNHMLFWHVTMIGDAMKLNTPNITNLSVKGCCWQNISGSSINSYASSFNQNHFITGTSYGSNVTNGNPDLVNISINDFRPSPTSILNNRITPLLIGIDINFINRNNPAEVGALEQQSSTGECLGDINDSGTVDTDDLLPIINSWGECGFCVPDITDDGQVNTDDLVIVLNTWGECF